MKRLITIITMVLLYSCSVDAQIVEPELREEVIIENAVFKVWYSEVKEQPTKLVYTSTNRVKNVDRGSMNFYTEGDVVTSNNADYYRNVWDKGHLAPAATYSDSMENLKQTFSFFKSFISAAGIFSLKGKSITAFTFFDPVGLIKISLDLVPSSIGFFGNS